MASRSRAGSLTSGMTSSSSLEQSIRRELAEIAEAEAVVDAEVLELLVKIGAMEAPQSKGGDERAGKKLSTSTSSSKASTDFRSHIGKLREFAPCFEAMAQDSKRLSGQIDDCRVLSDRLSSMVRRLDVIQIRAQQALACTEDVLNLKTCRQGIEAALQEQKLQIAVGYVKMVHDIDPEVAKSSDDYGAVLQGERETKALVHEEFKRALEGSDIQTVIALCPTLQTLGLESEARDSFLEFMERNVFIAVSADACSVDGVTEPATGYAFALSNIFNTVFAIIQQYLPVVIEGMENSNGDIHFIRRLHARCVKEAGSVLKRYMKYRGLKELVGSLKSVNTSRSIVIADVHSILDEFTLMLQYCCSYSDFINSLTRSAETRTLKNSSKNDSRIVFSAAHENTFTKMVDELVNMYYLECEMWLIRHGVQSAIQTALIKDNFSGVGSQSSSGDLAQKEGTEDADSTWMDECFFVLQRCGLRAIATKNIQAACAVLHVVSDQLSGDVVKFVSTRLNHSVTKLTTALANEVAKFTKKEADSSSSSIGSAGAFAFKSAFSLASSLTSSQGSGAATAPADSGSDALSKDLLDGLNSCFTCTRYIHRLTQEVVQNGKSVFVSDSSTSAAPASRSSGAPHSDALAKLMVCRDDFEAANVAFKRALSTSIEQVGEAFDSSLRALLALVFSKQGPLGGVKLSTPDDSFDLQPAVALLPKSIIDPIELLINICTHETIDSVKEEIILSLLEASTRRLEQFALQSTFSFAGALKFEECVRAVISLFSRYSTTSVRSKFTRIREIMSILSSDVSSAATLSEGFMVLSPEDINSFLTLRIDYRR